MRLDIEQTATGYYQIGWWDERDGIEGDLCLGEYLPITSLDSAKERYESEEHNFISNHVKEEEPPDNIDCDRLQWETRKQAIRALRIARSLRKEFKAKRAGKTAWPDWAKKALAEGWKPPRGWTPC